jgi:hypothetical protein
VTQFPLGPALVLAYLLAMAAGVAAGWVMVGSTQIRADKHKGLTRLPGSWSVLVLILAIFAVKYTFGFLYATEPALAQHSGFYLSDIAASGLITGAFIRKLARYAALYRAAPHEDLALPPEAAEGRRTDPRRSARCIRSAVPRLQRQRRGAEGCSCACGARLTEARNPSTKAVTSSQSVSS